MRSQSQRNLSLCGISRIIGPKKEKKRKEISQDKGIQEAAVSYISKVEQKLGRASRSTLLPHVFSLFLVERSKASAYLRNFYTNTSADSVLHSEPLHGKLKLSNIINGNKEKDRLAK
jgi:hypothetical protein